jgi:hypothetical protein
MAGLPQIGHTRLLDKHRHGVLQGICVCQRSKKMAWNLVELQQ